MNATALSFPDPHVIPASGSLLVGPLTPDDTAPLLLIAPPEHATQLVLRGITDTPEATVTGGVRVEVDGKECKGDFLPLQGGFWLRLDLKDRQEGDDAHLHLVLPQDPALRFVLIRVSASGPALACPSFTSFAPTLPRPARAPVPFDPAEVAGHLAALMRTNDPAFFSALNRIPNPIYDAVAANLLEALADDPGDPPSALLPFLMLLARD